MKVIHVPCYSKSDPLPVLGENFSRLDSFKSIGVIATAQHLDKIDDVAAFLKERGKKVFVGGQILGCDASSALSLSSKVDCFIYLGSGRFHPLAIAVETQKPVYVANPLSQSFDEITIEERERWIKRKKGRITKAAAAETFGVLVSTKTGQFHLKEALVVKKKLESSGRKAFLFSGDFLSPENLMPFRVDAWVDTACPRIADDHHEKPVVTVKELSEWLD